MAYKIVIGMKDGKSYQKELTEDESKFFIQKKVREVVQGDAFGFSGVEFLITGGSDNAGFALRADVPGHGRRKILGISGIGMSKKDKGVRRRRTVAGQVIGEQTAQINLKPVKGEDKVAAALAPKEETPAAEA